MSNREEKLLARLQGRYLDSVSTRIDALALLLCRCVAGIGNRAPVDGDLSEGPEDEKENLTVSASEPISDLLEEATRIVHGLVGSGGSYGFPEITAWSRPMEDALTGIRDRVKVERETPGDVNSCAVTGFPQLLPQCLDLLGECMTFRRRLREEFRPQTEDG